MDREAKEAQTQITITCKLCKEATVRLLPVLILSTLISVTGCTASQQQIRSSSATLNASADNRPDWLQTDSFERDGFRYFVGSASDVIDLNQGLESADLQARKAIVATVQADLRREFAPRLKGRSEKTVQAFESSLSASISGLQPKGIMHVNRYWERSRAPQGSGDLYRYQMSLLVRISKVEYTRIWEHAFQELSRQLSADTAHLL
jgi:hypothetical protein